MWHELGWYPGGASNEVFDAATSECNMPRLSMKLIASAVGSLALLAAAGCEQRTESTPAPDQISPMGTPRDSNTMQPTVNPPAASAMGSAAGGTTSVSAMPSEKADTIPVKGTDSEPMGSGGHGGGHGAGGHAGHKSSH
jgi:hypothetical protein